MYESQKKRKCQQLLNVTMYSSIIEFEFANVYVSYIIED